MGVGARSSRAMSNAMKGEENARAPGRNGGKKDRRCVFARARTLVYISSRACAAAHQFWVKPINFSHMGGRKGRTRGGGVRKRTSPKTKLSTARVTDTAAASLHAVMTKNRGRRCTTGRGQESHFPAEKGLTYLWPNISPAIYAPFSMSEIDDNNEKKALWLQRLNRSNALTFAIILQLFCFIILRAFFFFFSSVNHRDFAVMI